jgi:two-component system sensor histidine kinase KdpD
MPRGLLRVYLGAAPGVGKTFAMLNEGRRRARRGADVVIGIVDCHGRSLTAAQADGLERIPPTASQELDVAAVLRRTPRVVLVDELAHANARGSSNAKRWQDIDALLDAGIDVISTVSIEHLESLNDVVEAITGCAQRETVPDAWVRAADQIELVDCTPEALRRRMAHGNVYPADQIDAALANSFRVGSLSALRELALLWVADRVDDSLAQHRDQQGLAPPWETRERVVVALTGAPGADHVIRRAARIAARARAGLVGVHVRTGQTGSEAAEERLDSHRRLLIEVGGRYREAAGADVAQALVDVARMESATQLVIGASRRSRWTELTSGSVVTSIIRAAGAIDVHVVNAHEEEPAASMAAPSTRPRGVLPRRRRALGWALAVSAPAVLTAALSAVRDDVRLPSILLLFLLTVVGSAAVGGVGPAVLAAVAASLQANWFFFPPTHSWTIEDADNVVAFAVFITVGITVSWFVGAVSRRSAESARTRAEAETLMRLAAASASSDPLVTLAAHLCDAFTLDAVSLLTRVDGAWTVEASAGASPPGAPEAANETIAISEDVVLALRGRAIPPEDRRVLQAFADQLAVALRWRHLTQGAAEAAELAKINELRTALLAAVSHDLRTPLAGIKASVTSLLAADIDWDPEARREFCVAIDEEADRLASLVANLLDMSRLATDSLSVRDVAIGVEEIVPAALASLGDRARQGRVVATIPETLPRVRTDPALLERAVANLIANAIAWSPSDQPVRLVAGVVGGEIHLRIVDRGPGIPVASRDLVFRPFQRLGDRSNGAGVGLGLAVADGFVRAVGGELRIEDTPGGGTTMVVTMPVASDIVSASTSASA